MHRNSFIACILTLACFFVLIPSLGTAQSDKVKTSMAALEAAATKLGAPSIQGSDLYFGKTKASANLVDAVTKAQGGEASLFGKAKDQYVRVATTVKKEDGPAPSAPPWTRTAPLLQSSTMVKLTMAMRRSSARSTTLDMSQLRPQTVRSSELISSATQSHDLMALAWRVANNKASQGHPLVLLQQI
jgi:Cache 3/Cache 2 fusion domain